MAVQPWELDESPQPQPKPLVLVPPPRRRGHPIVALLMVLLVGGALAAPALDLVGRVDRPLTWGRAVPAASLGNLDPIGPMPRSRWPQSPSPVPGIAYVSCTRLWTSLADGTRARKILEMPGVSSPTFSPGGRTIAFLHTDSDGPALWMVGADGSQPTRVGRLTVYGDPVPARATGLTWSPKGEQLAFALVTPEYDAFSGGASIHTLDLPDGSFDGFGAGWPAPFWDHTTVGFSMMSDGKVKVYSARKPGSRASMQRRMMSGEGDELTADSLPTSWGALGPDLAILRTGREGLEIALRSHIYAKRDRRVIEPPSNHEFLATARPVVAQDGTRVIAGLVDPSGERDLGFYETATGNWEIVDYAWSASQSQAPSATGPVKARRARAVVEDFLSSWMRRPHRALMLGGARFDEDAIPLESGGYVVGEPIKAPGGWRVGATAYGRIKDAPAREWGYRDLLFDVTTTKGRLLAIPHATSTVKSLATIEDAFMFLEETLGVEVVRPPVIPEGARLDLSWPVDAWSWGGETPTGSVRLLLPGQTRHNPKQLIFGYGEQYFSMGCGGAEGRPGTVLEQPALLGSVEGTVTNQVLWPVFGKRQTGDFSIYANLPAEQVMDLAEAIEASR